MGNFSSLKPKPSGKNRDAFLEAIETMSFQSAYNKYGIEYTGKRKLNKKLKQFKDSILNKLKKK